MAKVKIPYYVVKKGNGYWQPTRAMRDLGFASVPLGKDGPKAWQLAAEWNERWQRQKGGSEQHEKLKWPARSIGDAFERYQKTSVWAEKKPRTREEWERGFAKFSPLFGDMRPTEAGISIETISAMRDKIKEKVSPREAWRTIKIWRALWTICQAMGYTEGRSDPSKGIQNTQPESRSVSWQYPEVVRLVKTAWRMKYYGLSAAIAVAWDTMLSPVDIRSLTVAQFVQDGAGAYFTTGRAKTGRAAIGTLSRRSERVLKEYLALKPVTVGLIFRNRTGAGYSRFTLPDDFKVVRDAAFPKDLRTLADMRRSGAMEARAGGADPSTLSAKMANNISTSNALHKAYQPVDLASVRQADSARSTGRQKMKDGAKLKKKLE